jgi:glutamate/tyrosine decarboxylase-like PLP-dependent enzyme
MSDELALPKNGMKSDTLRGMLRDLHAEDYAKVSLRAGQLTHWALGPQAIPDADFADLAREAVAQFAYESQFYVKTQPSLKRFHDDIIKFVASLHGAGPEAGGSVTMGGTESNMLAMKAARDRARTQCPRIREPEAVMPRTAHPSFVKGEQYLGVKTVRVPTADDFRADVSAMADAITDNTIMLVASAPTYPHGAIDPIDALADLAKRRGLWLHVDSCVGGIIGPFMRQLQEPIPHFGFAHDGVTSISVDLHKHGYTPVGVSSIIYRDASLLKYQEFIFNDWPNGFHMAPVIVGSRPAGTLAGAWATIMYLGQSGYLELARRIIEIRDRLLTGIAAIPELRVFGDPKMTMIAFGSSTADPFAVGDVLTERGWNVHRLQEPRGLHLIVDPFRDDSLLDDYLADLAAAVTRVLRGGLRAKDEHVTYG